MDEINLEELTDFDITERLYDIRELQIQYRTNRQLALMCGDVEGRNQISEVCQRLVTKLSDVESEIARRNAERV